MKLIWEILFVFYETAFYRELRMETYGKKRKRFFS